MINGKLLEVNAYQEITNVNEYLIMAFSNNIVSRFFVEKKFRILRHLSLLMIITIIVISFLWYVPVDNVPVYYKVYAWIVYMLVFVGIIYTNIYITTPRLLLKNKSVKYALVLSGFILITVVTIIIVQYGILAINISGNSHAYAARLFVNISSIILVLFFLFMGTTNILLVKQRIISDIEKSELESSLLESELKLLKNQVNPHFLFNMLNNANMLLKKDKYQASEVLFKLEDLLRYQIYDNINKDEVLLLSEINFLDDYLKLERIRRDNFDYAISKDNDCLNIKIPPLLFIVFVENAVKHNADNENHSYVKLSFTFNGKILKFTCENSKSEYSTQSNEVGGLGLKNIKRRLDLLFPNNHTLKITDEKLKYTINLMISI